MLVFHFILNCQSWGLFKKFILFSYDTAWLRSPLSPFLYVFQTHSSSSPFRTEKAKFRPVCNKSGQGELDLLFHFFMLLLIFIFAGIAHCYVLSLLTYEFPVPYQPIRKTDEMRSCACTYTSLLSYCTEEGGFLSNEHALEKYLNIKGCTHGVSFSSDLIRYRD